MKCINECDKDAVGPTLNNLETPKYPQPLPMAPRETFDNMFLRRDFLNKINDPNIDYRYNMDLSVDYEVNTTPFASKPDVVPPSEIGQSIPTTPIEKISSNPLLDVTTAISPQMSRADIPFVDMISSNYSGYNKMLGEYGKTIGSSIKAAYESLSKNDAISGIFKDNVKIISLLIAVAAGSFILNAGVSALIVGIILMFALKNASGLF